MYSEGLKNSALGLKNSALGLKNSALGLKNSALGLKNSALPNWIIDCTSRDSQAQNARGPTIF